MQNKSSNNSNEKNLSKSMNIDKENMICKDGFCTLQNRNQTSIINKRNENLFDPI